jgi:L-lactate dehydrogenase complex protein LldG
VAHRQDMLERIRRALGKPPRGETAYGEQLIDLPALGAVMPAIPPEELIPKFESELAKVSGMAYRCSNLQELEGHLKSIFGESDGGIVLSRNPLLARLGLPERLQAWGKTVSTWSEDAGDASAAQGPTFRERAFAADVGITGVDFVLAESGTLVLSSATEGAQLASLAPPLHVALYRREQVLGSLEEVLERLPVPRQSDTPAPGRAVVFITGPSRTADIEQILIRGVHGPREVHAILVEEACLV